MPASSSPAAAGSTGAPGTVVQLTGLDLCDSRALGDPLPAQLRMFAIDQTTRRKGSLARRYDILAGRPQVDVGIHVGLPLIDNQERFVLTAAESVRKRLATEVLPLVVGAHHTSSSSRVYGHPVPR